MQEYKKRLRNRIIFCSIGIVILLVIALYSLKFNFDNPKILNDWFSHFLINAIQEESGMKGFRAGICSGAIAILFYLVVTSCIALRNENKLKKNYIKEHDEREREIQYKSIKMTVSICSYVLLVALFIASMYKFYTVLSVLYVITMIICFVTMVTKFYYRRKL